jgi:hypothetical protein
MNSANEEAVALFLAGRIGFLDIPRLVEEEMEAHMASGFLARPDLSAILALTVLPELVAPESRGLPPILAAGVANLAFWSVALVFRHRLLHNSASRHIMMWLAVTIAVLLMHRIVSLGLHDDPVDEVAARDSLLLTALSGYAAIVLSHRFWPAPLVGFTAFAIALASPSLARHVFGAAMVLNLLIAASVWGEPREPRVPTRRSRLTALRGSPPPE